METFLEYFNALDYLISENYMVMTDLLESQKLAINFDKKYDNVIDTSDYFFEKIRKMINDGMSNEDMFYAILSDKDLNEALDML